MLGRLAAVIDPSRGDEPAAVERVEPGVVELDPALAVRHRDRQDGAMHAGQQDRR